MESFALVPWPRIDPGNVIEISPADLESVRSLYRRGFYLQAYERACEIGPVTEWSGTAALLVASRLVLNLGGSQLSRWLVLRAYRGEPENLEVIYYHVLALWRRAGSLRAWRFLERLGTPLQGPVRDRANLMGLRARLTNEFRDFHTANRFLDEAEELDPENVWLKLDRAYSLEEQDDYQGALAASQEVLEARPGLRRAVQAVAYHLQLLSRDQEALDLLRAGMSQFESEAVAAQLATLEGELGLYAEARETLARYRLLAPLMETRDQQWWDAQMSDVHYHLGNIELSATHARAVKGSFYERIAARLSDPKSQGRRVHLPVGFVRQHSMTCAPATLTALSQFWQLPVDHLSLAAAICYDGTPDHVERHWAENNGWAVAEFRLTWDTAVALLDRSVPFTVTTVETESAHLQAVIGYDERRGTLLIRDPYDRLFREFAADLFFERYAATGPRALALVPETRRDLLDGIELPEARLYDYYYHLRRALERHDRKGAEASLEQLKSEEPGHRLFFQGCRMLALYDSNERELLAATEKILSRFAEHNGMLSLSKLASLRSLGQRRDYLAFLKEKTSGKDAEPAFLREYAREVFEDASQRRLTRRLLSRAMRLRPRDPDNLHVLAGLLWEQRDFADATKVYRLAASVADKTEYFFRSYFTASRQIGDSAIAIGWLKKRFEQYGRLSSLPARTLFWALNILDRTAEGFAILEEALGLRPADGDLLTFAADEYARFGEGKRANELLNLARGRASRGTWLRSRGTIAENEADLVEALAVWREVLTLEPLAMDANRAVARLIAEVEGRAAALQHLQEVCARFSHHVPLRKLWLEWTRELEEREKILRTLLGLSPEDAWTHRELALLLAERTRFDEAHRAIERARAFEPLSPSTHSVAGRLFYLEGRNTEAAEAYRRAISLSVDFEAAVEGLLLSCPDFEAKREALAYVFQELKRQVSLGDGMLAYREAAYAVLDPPQLLANLQEALAARPDLWHAWSAVVAQLTAMNRLEEALVLARDASARFPLLPRIWYELAQVHKARREPAEEIASLARALETNPAWGYASRELSSAHERAGDLNAAEAVLRKAIAAVPSDPFNRGYLADLQWRRGERDAAIAEVQHAIILNPDYDWGWQVLHEWSVEEGGENLALAAARDSAARRPGESRSWLRLAEILREKQNFAERLDAIEHALKLNPRNVEAWDARATAFAEVGRYREALESCRPETLGPEPPVNLRGRSAWVEAQRGRLDDAIRQMQAVLDHAPDYYWGWARLAEWHIEKENAEAALEAAEQMSRLQPTNATVLGYLGDARLALSRREEAKDAFVHAWDLDPLYSYGANKLFDLQLEDRDFAQAEATVERMRRHVNDAQAVANEVRLAAARGNREDAFTALEDLCRRKGSIAYVLHLAANAVRDAGWGSRLRKFFGKLLQLEDVNPDVGDAWVTQLTHESSNHRWLAAHRLRVRTPAEKQALRSLVNLIGDENRKWLLRYLLWRLEPVIREDEVAWANVSYAFANLAEYRRAVRWLDGWRSRPEILPWTLLNLAVSLAACGRHAEAREASLAALALPGDHSQRSHCLIVAHDAVIRGDFAEAARFRAQADDAKATQETDVVAPAVDALLELHQLSPPERRRAVKGIRAQLREKVRGVGVLPAGLRRMFRRTLIRLADDAGEPFGKLRAFFQTMPSVQVRPSTIQLALIIGFIFHKVALGWLGDLVRLIRSLFAP